MSENKGFIARNESKIESRFSKYPFGCFKGVTKRCLPVSPKPVSPKTDSPKPDSPKLGLGGGVFQICRNPIRRNPFRRN